MITISEAQRIIFEHLPEPVIEQKPLLSAASQVLAEDILSPEPMPGFTNSAMDGYAVALRDAGRTSLPHNQFEIAGESSAGHPYPNKIIPGTAILISTGAKVPEGTHRIVPVENAKVEGRWLTALKMGKQGAHIRWAGEEIQPGGLLLEAGSILNAEKISFLAGFGITDVKVYSRPRIAVLTTGEELVPYPEKPAEGQIRNTNQIFLIQFLNDLGIRPVYCKHVPDAPDRTVDAIAEAHRLADIILISGGVSVGPHDHVKSAAEQQQFKRLFWGVNQKPGKPLYFATRENVCLFGMPGNPLSVILISYVYLYPVIRRLMAVRNPQLPMMKGKFGSVPDGLIRGREKIFLVKIKSVQNGVADIAALPLQRSHKVSCAVWADGFVFIPGNRETVRTDEVFKVYKFPGKN